MATTNAANSFGISWAGGMQGMDMADPSSRNYLSGGYFNPASTQSVMYGGVGISEYIPSPLNGVNNPVSEMGPKIDYATTVAAGVGSLTGFSVWTQNYAAILTQNQEVPVIGYNMEVNFYRFGTNARIWVACDPTIGSYDGSIFNTQWSWDFTTQQLIPYVPSFGTVTITGAVWASTNGGQTTFTVGTNLTTDLAAGDYIDTTGVVSSPVGVFNGHFEVVSVTSTTVVVQQIAASSPGTYTSGGTIVAEGGAIPIKGVLKIETGNSMVVAYNLATQSYYWNRQGSTALILL
ncbi:unnamed protein product [Sphagnum balticum]